MVGRWLLLLLLLLLLVLLSWTGRLETHCGAHGAQGRNCGTACPTC